MQEFKKKVQKKRIFNYRLSRARRVSENVFGIWCAIFRVFRKPLLLEPETATKIVLAAAYLHNFLRKSPSRNIYNPVGSFDNECPNTGSIIPGIWRRDLKNVALNNFKNIPRKSSLNAQQVRDEFAEYFYSKEGAVPWQNQTC